MTDLRVGIGVDAHAFSEEAVLVLGGVELPGEAGLAGHSDGDVVAHALVDAVLGAAGLGDIGSFFPSDDAEWEGASSLLFLERAMAAPKTAVPAPNPNRQEHRTQKPSIARLHPESDLVRHRRPGLRAHHLDATARVHR